MQQAMRQANLAAGVVVGKLGTATCSLEELKAARP
jgi:bifunctional ADP-heptose synthase (sugar kinase/adenylyltransferase)